MGGQPDEPGQQRERVPGHPPRGRADARQERPAARRAGSAWRGTSSPPSPASTTSTSRSATSPTRRSVPEDWQRHMTTVVAEAVAKLPQPVLLSQNVSNQGRRVVDPHPAISIFNFHYATPPDTIAVERASSAADRRQRDRLQRHGRRALPHRGLGLHPGRRRPLQQPRLLVHGRPRRRHVPVPADAAGRRRRHAAAAADDAARVHRRLRPRAAAARAWPRDRGRAARAGRRRCWPIPARAYGVYLRRQTTAAAFSARWTGVLRAAGHRHLSDPHHVERRRPREIGDRVLFEDWTTHGTKTDTVPLASDGRPARSRCRRTTSTAAARA